MTAGLERISTRREPRATEVARRIIDYLLSGQLEPGDRIPSERQLAEALGVGRSLLREALKSIALLGLVEVRPGDGTFLVRAESELLPKAIEWGLLLGEQQVADLMEARHLLEVLVAGLAAERRTPADIAMLRTYYGQMQAAPDTTSFVAADMAFHLRVAEAANNGSLLKIMASIRALLRVWIDRVRSAEPDNRRSTEEHAAILLALEAGDPEDARAAMEVHMASATRRLLETVDAHAGPEADAGNGKRSGQGFRQNSR
jgi:GntR family transcriptional repressor for pyruvate dehydrogenase complex